jgi:hypothetical protein
MNLLWNEVINYAERGDFTIDVMMYDLPKDVQEVLPRYIHRNVLC